MLSAVLAEPEMPGDTGQAWLVYLLFMVSGLLVGGAISAYRAERKALTIVLGVLALIGVAGGVMWMIGELGA
ncbi:hypothetical protein CCICO_03935 [Corynebacterium ciconiae DSM 44920]|uniref:hypothetical protein n=1 Tax=Corynebacterium ciconiae TaxID=227319 RepID=UPI00037DC608|nr:hypothetical protein [Corynebacterium ciconiae]WKD60824.1 hypothetical protein CCICO_03935 [Corynebacterium ciconiae DSM 44920]